MLIMIIFYSLLLLVRQVYNIFWSTDQPTNHVDNNAENLDELQVWSGILRILLVTKESVTIRTVRNAYHSVPSYLRNKNQWGRLGEVRRSRK